MTTSTANYQNASNNPYASASLYVGDLSPETTEATLFELFNAVGPVASIRVCRDAMTRKSLGYAYVNFHSVSDADRALDTMNFTNIKGKQCRIMWSQRDPSVRKSGKGNVFVKNLDKNIDNKTLYDTFSVFGSILSCKIVTNGLNGESRGYGYVHYVKPEDAAKAIKGVNGMVIQDKKVEAELFKSREERQKLLKFTNVYIKYIPKKLKEEEFFELIREILYSEEEPEVDPITSKVFWSPEFGSSACINFINDTTAEEAVEKINGYDVSKYLDETEEKAVTEEESKPKKTQLFAARCEKRKDRDRSMKRGKFASRRSFRGQFNGINLYVKNLHVDVDDKKLEEMFVEYGPISSARVMRDHTQKSRGFGFVSFRNKEDATKAMFEMNSKVFNEKPLYVSKAQKKEQRRQYLAKQRHKIQQQPNFGGPMQGYPQGPFPPRPMQGYPPFGFPNTMQSQMLNRGFNTMQIRPPFGYPPNAMHNPMLFNQQRFPGHIGHNIPTQMAPFPLHNTQQRQQAQGQQQQPTGSNLMQSSVGQQLSRSMHNPNLTSVPGPSSHPQPSYGTSGVTHPAPVIQSNSTNNINPSTSRTNQPSVTISSHPNAPQSITQSGTNLPQAPQTSSQPQQSYSQTNQPMQSVGSSAPMREHHPLTQQMLVKADPAERKRLIGERLFPKIQEMEPRLAGKITGMLLEMDNTELLILLDNRQALVKKINEALGVLRDHRRNLSQKNTSLKNEGSQKNTSQKNLSAKNQTSQKNVTTSASNQ